MNPRNATTHDANAIQALILRAAEPQNNDDFDQEGVMHFTKINALSAIKRRLLNKEYLTLCFVLNKNIVGLITMYENEKISQLFVDPAFRGVNIAKKLWHAAKTVCSDNGNSGKYWVRSSTQAIPVYESFGFRLVGERQKKNGVIFYPMVFEVENN